MKFNIRNHFVCETFKDKTKSQKGELTTYHKTDEQEIRTGT